MFGGINIDLSQLQQTQEIYNTCREHPECNNCPYYNLQGANGTICETAIERINNGVSNESL